MTDEKLLLPAQKREIFNIFKGLSLNTYDFDFEVLDSEFLSDTVVTKLKHKHYNHFYYTFDFNFYDSSSRYRESIYSPCHNSKAAGEHSETFEYDDWDEQLYHFSNWAEFIYEQLKEPDPWEEQSKYTEFIDSKIDEESAEDTFTDLEIERIITAVNKVRAYIVEKKMANDDEIKTINTKLDFLIEQAKSGIKKINWYSLWVGFLITSSTSLLWDPEKSKVLYNIMKQALSGVKGFLGI